MHVYVNLWRRGPAHYQCDAFASRDAAAHDAAQPSIYPYVGTLCAENGATALVDLAGHGLALAREDRTAAGDEAAHERALRRGAGRIVL